MNEYYVYEWFIVDTNEVFMSVKEKEIDIKNISVEINSL